MKKAEIIKLMQQTVAEADSIARQAMKSNIDKHELDAIITWTNFAKIDAANAVRYYDYDQSHPQDQYYAAAIHLMQTATNALQKAIAKKPKQIDIKKAALEELQEAAKQSDEKKIELAILICQDDINSEMNIPCKTAEETYDYYMDLASTLTNK